MTSQAPEGSSREHSSASVAGGRWLVPLVATLGIAAVVAYGVRDAQRRHQAEDNVPAFQEEDAGAKPPPVVEVLETEVMLAIEHLDTVRLAELEARLWEAEQATTLQPRATLARLARGEAQATRALDAAIRAGIRGRHPATAAVALAREASKTLEPLSPSGPHATRIFAAQARAQLAGGADLIATTPRLLLPGYRDPQLRLAALSRPLWMPEEPISGDALGGLCQELNDAPPAALTRLLLALCLQAQKDHEGANAALEEVLRETPRQPTALALREAWQPAGVIADRPAPPGPASAPVTGPPESAEDPIASPTGAGPSATETSAPHASGEGAVASATVAPSVASGTSPSPAAPGTAPASPAAPGTATTSSAAPGTAAASPAAPGAATTSPTAPGTTTASPPAPGADAAQGTAPSRPASPEAQGAAEVSADPRTLTREGCKLVQTGNADRGVVLLRRAFDFNPGSEEITLCLAQGYRQQGKGASARALVERILRQSPQHTAARVLAAEIEDERGNIAGAARHYSKLLAQDPNHEVARRYLAEHPNLAPAP